jgi:hypothetical protein
LADTFTELYDSNGSLVGANNNWKDSQQAEIAATGHAPAHDAESALLATLAPGNYTARLSGASSSAGIGKTDVIDVDASSSSRLDSISTRAVVAQGERPLVAGFVINGPGSRRVIIRGMAPSWAQYIDGTMMDPTLQLRDGNGTPLVFNDDWADTQQSDVEASFLAPVDSRESAIVATLAPGSYTADLIGACGAGGFAIIDVHDLGPGAGSQALPGSSSAPTCFKTWAAEHGLTGAAAVPSADSDRDGVVNLLEYAFGKNPTINDGNATASGTVEVQGQKYLSLTYTLPTGDDAPSDLIYQAQRATSLAPADWSSKWTDFSTYSVTPGPGALETVTLRSTRAVGSIPREFLRLEVTLIAP